MSIRDELLALENEEGLIDPKVARDWAEKHPNSALHKALEWDKDKAAIEYQLSQIRRLISIHIVTVEGEREYVSLSIDRVPNGGYRAVNDVVQVKHLRDIMLADALAELERVQRKYERLEQLAEVWAAKDRVKRGSKGKRRGGDEARPTA